jgi:hypothetical protein
MISHLYKLINSVKSGQRKGTTGQASFGMHLCFQQTSPQSSGRTPCPLAFVCWPHTVVSSFTQLTSMSSPSLPFTRCFVLFMHWVIFVFYISYYVILTFAAWTTKTSISSVSLVIKPIISSLPRASKGGEFPTRWETVSFSRRTVLHLVGPSRPVCFLAVHCLRLVDTNLVVGKAKCSSGTPLHTVAVSVSHKPADGHPSA